jgi:hypothetical protein
MLLLLMAGMILTDLQVQHKLRVYVLLHSELLINRSRALCERDLFVALAWDAEAVEDCARRVGAVEGVEMDSGNVVIQKIVTLFQGEMETDCCSTGFAERCKFKVSL